MKMKMNEEKWKQFFAHKNHIEDKNNERIHINHWMICIDEKKWMKYTKEKQRNRERERESEQKNERTCIYIYNSTRQSQIASMVHVY